MPSLWIHMFITAALISLVTVGCYWLEKYRHIDTHNNSWQIILGIIFGTLSLAALTFGGEANGNIDNVQDIAPLLAGLLFGAPAGILAGILGAAGRILISATSNTPISYAAVLSLLAAGFFAAFLRRCLFDDKKPSAWYGLSIGFLMSICHIMLFMLLYTRLAGFYKTYILAETFLVPLAAGSGLGMLLAMSLVAYIGKEKRTSHTPHNGLAQIFQRWLLLCIITAYSITCVYIWFVQTQMAIVNVENTLRLNLNDLQGEILDVSDKNLLRIAKQVAVQITPACYVNENKGGTFYNHYLKNMARTYNLTDINLYDTHGINIASTQGEFFGYDMSRGTQSAEFLVLLQGVQSYVQKYQPLSSDPNVSRKYAGIPLENGGFVQVGYDAEHFHWNLQSSLDGMTQHRHVWYTGGIIIADSNGIIISDSENSTGKSLNTIGLAFPIDEVTDRTFQATIHNKNTICMYNKMEGYYIITYISNQEALFARNFSFSIMVVMELLLFAFIFLLVYFLVKKLVIDNIHKINDSLQQITHGNLNIKVSVHSNEEFTSLSEDINSTVETLKQYIAEAAARIDRELEFARNIQHASLPSVFPPYPERTDFSIFASMDTAKEVGGDFYDFYLLGENHLAFLIADVSGKGIPAALFMMKAKTLIKSLTESGLSPTDVFQQANEKLCEGNEAEMFVTAWLGILDTETGIVNFANAGHNAPILSQHHQPVNFLHMKADLVLGVIKDIPYNEGHFTMLPGDTIFLYTDGLPEAINHATEPFGKDRMLELVRQKATAPVEELLPAMNYAVKFFVGQAEQFDDITMLGLKYNGKPKPPSNE